MFELTIAKSELLPRLLMVAGAVDKRHSLPILSNILIRTQGGQLTFTATDLEMEISSYMACDASLSNAITVPAKKCIDIIRSLDDNIDPVIQFNAGTVLIRAGRSQFKLATLAAELFPNCQYEQAEFEFSLPRAAFIQVLQSTHFAMSQQDVRIFLNGMLLEFDGNNLTTVATDGHRMAICKLSCATKLAHHRVLLPRKGVLELIRLLSMINDETVNATVGKNYFRLLSHDYAFTSKLIEARFPAYLKAIPTDNDKMALVNKEALKRALSRIVILANEKSKAVLLHCQAGQGITLIANNQEQEEAIESIEAEIHGDPLKIGINASYLLDVLNYLAGTVVRLSMSTAERSILIESEMDDDYQYVIMPMKL